MAVLRGTDTRGPREGPRPGRARLGAAWGRERCPRPGRRWHEAVFKVFSNPNHSVIPRGAQRGRPLAVPRDGAVGSLRSRTNPASVSRRGKPWNTLGASSGGGTGGVREGSGGVRPLFEHLRGAGWSGQGWGQLLLLEGKAGVPPLSEHLGGAGWREGQPGTGLGTAAAQGCGGGGAGCGPYTFKSLLTLRR